MVTSPQTDIGSFAADNDRSRHLKIQMLPIVPSVSSVSKVPAPIFIPNGIDRRPPDSHTPQDPPKPTVTRSPSTITGTSRLPAERFSISSIRRCSFFTS
jgi:hypothetical protein